MAITSVLTGLKWPQFDGLNFTMTTNNLNAANLRAAIVGRISIEGRGTGKVISAAGGGSIVWRAASVTWANASTALDIGLQDVDVATGNPVRPDGTFDVKRTLVPGTDALANGAVTTAMTGGSGSKTLSHGDLIAVVFDMTARAGSDAVGVGLIPIDGSPAIFNLPTLVTYNGSAWSGGNWHLQCGIIFDDGTRGHFVGAPPLALSASSLTYADSSNPDEYGTTFEVPWDCKIGGIIASMRGASSTGDWEFQIYADPLGTPTSILPGGTAIAAPAESLRQYGAGYVYQPLPTEIAITRNTKYALTAKATGAGNVLLDGGAVTLQNAAWKQFAPGGVGASRVSRNNGSGAFSETAADVIPGLAVSLSGFHEDGGSVGARQKVYGG